MVIITDMTVKSNNMKKAVSKTVDYCSPGSPIYLDAHDIESDSNIVLPRPFVSYDNLIF